MARNTLLFLVILIVACQGCLLRGQWSGGRRSVPVLVSVAAPSRDVAGLLRAAGMRVGVGGDLQARSMNRGYALILERYGASIAHGTADDVAASLRAGIDDGHVTLGEARREQVRVLAREAWESRERVRRHQAEAAALQGKVQAAMERLRSCGAGGPEASAPGRDHGSEAWQRLERLLEERG